VPATSTVLPATLLSAVGVAKSFAGVRALRAASMDLRAGEVHALVGENGAGKSTFIKILTGAVQPDAGEVTLSGNVVRHLTPRRAKALGIAAIYQHPALFPELTVAENLAIGVEPFGIRSRVNWRARRERAAELLELVGSRLDPDVEAGSLSMPEQQLVEIARALGTNARILILDEPTASLSEEDTQHLFRVIRDLRERGVGLIYISHRLAELPLIADRVTVMRDGETIETREIKTVSRDQLIRLMVGRDLTAVFPKRPVSIGGNVLELRGVACADSGIHDVNLSVRAGEIVGLAGLVGAGRTELARTIFGLTPATAGEICLYGDAVVIDSASAGMSHGIAYVPEDRRRHGVVLPMSVAANVSLASLDSLRTGHFGSLDVTQEARVAAELAQRLRVKSPSVHTPVAALSGGNQQKVALARWLRRRPTVLILDEPTQGIDVSAKAEIHSLIGDLADQGVAILMISSELPEILGMSDRILVMKAGTIVDSFVRSEATQERILACALAS
jgi:rhamnose transport system ATP-binding protein